MKINELMNRPLPEIPQDILQALGTSKITMTQFEEKNEILVNENLQQEVGFDFFEDESALVSTSCPMTGLTSEMINWWFWWHPKVNERYQVWYPGEHFSNSYAKKDASYFEKNRMPAFLPNEQYPKERIGGKTFTLVIKFKHPEDMGFDCRLMKENRIPVIVCGSVGVKNLMMHTEMTHIFKQTEDGLVLISRFWMGKLIKNKFLRKKIITKQMARGMAEHCCVEYRNLAAILPTLYKEYGNGE